MVYTSGHCHYQSILSLFIAALLEYRENRNGLDIYIYMYPTISLVLLLIGFAYYLCGSNLNPLCH